MSLIESIIDIPVAHEQNIFGQYDSYLKKIEKFLNVTIVARDNTIKIIGTRDNSQKAKAVFNQLMTVSGKGESINEQTLDYILALSTTNKENQVAVLSDDLVCHTINGKPIRPKTIGQKTYLDQIRKKTIVFGVGPAGTGKTYLAMAMAITAFKNNEVNRIILTRPAIEAGEKLGFLPGDLQSKVDPYLRPLYDALYEIMGAESYLRNVEKGLIEVAPLAYMRGRTLDNSFIILDEAQNTTPAQMKMFLTRVGFGSKVIVTGDLTQKDLPSGQHSGLEIVLKILKNIDDIGISYFTNLDVVRHPLVQKIVKAYEVYETQRSSSRPVKSRRRKHDRDN